MKFEKTVTKQPRKKRLARYRAKLHEKRKWVFVHLSKELKKKYKKRALQAKKEDKVRVARGAFKKRQGKIIEVDVKDGKLFIDGLVRKKQRGEEVFAAIEPSNCVLVEWKEPKLKEKRVKNNG